MERFGWKPSFEASFRELCGGELEPARVTEEQKQDYWIQTARGALRASLAGRMRHEAICSADLPTVGDWVGVFARHDEGEATVHRLLPRDTALTRNVAGRREQAQIMAANVDKVLLVTSLDRDFNIRRIERFLTQVWESGAQPVLVLSKADLCSNDQAESLKGEAEAAAYGVPVICLSSHTGVGLFDLLPHLEARKTLVLVGKSGVGKSTLINAMAGEEVQMVHAIRDSDGRGRHTTTCRQLRELPGGALLIDTPGIREIALWDASEGVGTVFSDIEELASTCRFRDCTHDGEPGCAVRTALREGSLDADRWASYLKLKRELAYQERKIDHAARQAERLKWKRITKTYRDRVNKKP